MSETKIDSLEAFRLIRDRLVESDPEGTDSPYWLIIDPGASRNIKTTVDQIAACITGPFFSRKDAESHLGSRRYAFSRKAAVYCHSGYSSVVYKIACRDLKDLESRR